jgi:hypothetical protein
LKDGTKLLAFEPGWTQQTRSGADGNAVSDKAD